MTFFSVFAVSLSIFFFEVLINRSFAITQWSHLAFMVIGVALFGLSAGSVWLHMRMIRRALIQKKPNHREVVSHGRTQHRGGEVTSRKDTINGRVETYTGSGFRSAPGLSLTYTGELPSQTGVFIDSSSPVALYTGHAPETTILDRNKARASIVGNHYISFGITVVPGPPRYGLQATRQTYDIIAVDHLGTTTPGLISINEDYTLTVDTMAALYGKLSPEGVASISRRLQIPPPGGSGLLQWNRTAEQRPRVING